MIQLITGVEVRIFKTDYFQKLAEHEGLMDKQILEIVKEMEGGLHNGDLGGHVFKKRIPIGSQGKRGVLRSIIAYKKGSKAIFMYGYTKNVLDNISPKEKEAYKKLSKSYFSLDEVSLKRLLKNGELIEVRDEQA